MPLRQRLLKRLRGAPPPAPAPRPPPGRLEDYRPLHPALRALQPEQLDPALREALAAGQPARVVEAVHPGLYALRVFTPEACRALLEELDHFEAFCARERVPVERPNSMNHHGALLDDIGLTEMSTALTRQVLRPLGAALFPGLGCETLHDPHAFSVEYAPGKDRHLGFHVDDSELTLNLCLGERFDGGELYFEGLRCALHRQTRAGAGERVEWAHQPGLALLHAGKHRHGALRLMGGRRVNLIVWARSRSYREAVGLEEAECPPWCQAAMAEAGVAPGW
ncbi:MAG: hypothetical protein H6740_19955 [Alphaproteobacteria bacterium]|nr:hypothetical protein [Alphaproteobacteria bacterium]